MAIVASATDNVPTESEARSWAQSLKEAVREPRELCRLLDLPDIWTEQAQLAMEQFPLFAPREFIAQMKPGDPHDPLLRQVLPLSDELAEPSGFSIDPLDENRAKVASGLLSKYQGRALLMVASQCAVHCRYCFRRHYPYQDLPKGLDEFSSALSALQDDTSIEEVILSGGDPLIVVDARLRELVQQLEAVPHLRRLRIHTRLPVMIPSRVCSELLDWLTATSLTVVMVLHINHPQEMSSDVGQAIEKLTNAGIPVLNQAVLLRGVNDEPDVQVELSRRLVNQRVMPYYLHLLDRVQGTAHFEVSENTGRKIIRQMHARLPGYAIPRLVREVPGEAGKTFLA